MDAFFDKILQEKESWTLYSQRGKTRGIIVKGKKYRFTTLGISKEQMEGKVQKELSLVDKRRKELEALMKREDNNPIIER
jgi:hypothetical protein